MKLIEHDAAFLMEKSGTEKSYHLSIYFSLFAYILDLNTSLCCQRNPSSSVNLIKLCILHMLFTFFLIFHSVHFQIRHFSLASWNISLYISGISVIYM